MIDNIFVYFKFVHSVFTAMLAYIVSLLIEPLFLFVGFFELFLLLTSLMTFFPVSTILFMPDVSNESIISCCSIRFTTSSQMIMVGMTMAAWMIHHSKLHWKCPVYIQEQTTWMEKSVRVKSKQRMAFCTMRASQITTNTMLITFPVIVTKL